jgi:LuxR family maltose regulon positive regulatory protein
VRQALTRAHERRMLRLFIDAGAATAALLHELVQGTGLAAADSAFACEVLRRLAAPAGGRAHSLDTDTPEVEAQIAATLPHLAEALSLRETEILGLLAQVLSTKSIARVLDVSAGTVKWHLKNVYAKLGVASREQAVLKARGLRLIA